MDNNELYHHGVKGQKHGVRRFQFPNGTWTALGKARRRAENDGDSSSKKDSETNKSKAASATVNKNTKTSNDSKPKEDTDNKTEETLEEKKQRILRGKSAKDIYMNSQLFTDKEIADAATRLSNEEKIKALIPSKKPGLKEKLADSLKAAVLPAVTEQGKKYLTKMLEEKLGLKEPKDPIKTLSEKLSVVQSLSNLEKLTGNKYGHIMDDVMNQLGYKAAPKEPEAPKSAIAKAKEILSTNKSTNDAIKGLEGILNNTMGPYTKDSVNNEIVNLIEELKKGLK